MANTSTSLPILLAKPAATLFIVVAGVVLAAGICFSNQVVPLALGLACFVLLLALSRLKTANLLMGYVVADHLCQFLKRAIFLLGPQPMLVYWGFQLLPTLVLFLAVVSSLYSMRKTSFPLSAKLLGAFIAIAIAQTFLNPNGSEWVSRFAGSNQAIIPLFAAFAAMTLAPGDWKRMAKVFLVLIVLSSIYGVFQLVHGPTIVDRAWAIQTGDYSIQGNQVYEYITGGRNDFRAYSYYSDPANWGFFLVLGFLFLKTVQQRVTMPPGWLKLAFGMCVCGMIATETRTVWVALLGAFVVHRVLGTRAFRHPLLVVSGILVAFGLVLTGGQYALVHWVPAVTGSALVNRYMDVGTISARTSALEIFIRVLPRHVILGDGYSTAGTALESVNQSSLLASDYFSHNAIVGLLLTVGLPGLLIFGAFLYRWLWEALRTVNRSSPDAARAQLWIVSACVGMLFTGALTGPLFMSSTYFQIFLGLAMGETMRLRQASEAERSWLTAGPKRRREMAVAGRTVDVRG